MSLTDFAKPEIVPNAEATLRHVLESGVTVVNTAGALTRHLLRYLKATRLEVLPVDSRLL